MTYFSMVTRAIRRYFCSTESLILMFTVLIVCYCFKNGLRSILTRLKTRLQGHYYVGQSGLSSNTGEKTKASWELLRDNVGVYAIQGRRPHMEDRFNVVNNLEDTNTSIYGVFDGHGGEFAADFCEKTLFKMLMVRLLKEAMAEENEDLSDVLTEEILNVDQQLLHIEHTTNELSGTTALVALLRNNKLTVANVGDSRGVLCNKHGKAVPISYDHKPQQLKERKRIRKAGGFISFNGVWRVAGVLATSRALGDFPLKDKNFITATPDILTFDLEKIEAKFVILATDGLWDAFTNEEAVNYIKDRLDEPHYGAKSIVLQAYYRGSLDNITVMVINLSKKKVATASTQDKRKKKDRADD